MSAANLSKLDDFARAYMECALWSSTDNDGEPLDKRHGLADFSPACVASMLADCKRFQSENAADLSPRFVIRCGPSGYSAYQGHDFWLTRNRHGAGYWDGDYEESAGKRLTEASHKYTEVYLYVGDDGLIYS